MKNFRVHLTYVTLRTHLFIVNLLNPPIANKDEECWVGPNSKQEATPVTALEEGAVILEVGVATTPVILSFLWEEALISEKLLTVISFWSCCLVKLVVIKKPKERSRVCRRLFHRLCKYNM